MYTIKGKWTPEGFFQLHGNGRIELSANGDDTIIHLNDGTFLSTGENHFHFERWF